MTFNWKKTGLILIDIALGVYIVLAITAFNRPDAQSDVCNEVNINIEAGIVKGFLTVDGVKHQLQRAHVYPLGEPLEQVSLRRIEEVLRQNLFVESAECYKTQTGHVNITLSQRMPVMRVKAANGEDYYIDSQGKFMPSTEDVSNLVVATGHVSKAYAQKTLTRIGLYLLQHPVWLSQTEQINVLADGSIEMVPRVGDHIVYIGSPDNFEKGLKRLGKFYRYGLSKAGWNKYSYISVEFDNQIICKKSKNVKI